MLIHDRALFHMALYYSRRHIKSMYLKVPSSEVPYAQECLDVIEKKYNTNFSLLCNLHE